MRNRTWLKVQKCRSDLNCLKSSRIEEWVLATGIWNTLSCVESKGFANRCWRKFRHHKTRCVRRGIDVKLLVSIKLTVIQSFFYFFDFPETPWVALTSICCKHGRRVKEPIFRNGTWIYIRSQLQQMFGKLWQIWRWSGGAAASGSGRNVWLQELRSFATCKTHLALASPALAISLTHDDKLQNVFGDFLAWSCKIILLGDCCFLL